MAMHDQVTPQARLPAPGDDGAAGTCAESVEAAIRCVDAALWHQRSVLAAMVTALSGHPPCDRQDAGTEPLWRELRMARLLCSVEASALRDSPLVSDASMSARDGGWATVLEVRDEALERLADELDAALVPRGEGRDECPGKLTLSSPACTC